MHRTPINLPQLDTMEIEDSAVKGRTFFDLPIEVRDEIYWHSFGNEQGNTSFFFADQVLKCHRHLYSPQATLKLILTCQTVYEEATRVLYSI